LATSARENPRRQTFSTIDPFAKPYLKDIRRWAFTNELWLTVERAKLIAQQANPDVFTVVDSGLLISWMYVFSHRRAKNITLKEWQFIRELYDHFAENFMSKTLVVCLRYPLPTLMERIKKRGRPFELEYYTPEYIGNLNKGLIELEKKLRKLRVPLLVVREKSVADFVENAKDRRTLVKKARAFLKQNLK
jgi:deoxyadenosine/deoxycytidine kinase